MQKLIFSFIFGLLFPFYFFAQTNYPLASFSGHITDVNTGLPVANQPVTIYALYGTANWYYGNVLYTDANGYYADSTQPDTSNVILYVYTTDCNGNYRADSLVYNNGLQNAVVNFSICTGAPSISAHFEYTQTSNYSLQFNNLSTGVNSLQYLWDFGNGTTSTQANPTVSYAAPGAYNVVLTASDNSSSVQYSQTVFVQGTQGNCQAGFSYTTDIYGGVILTNTSVNLQPPSPLNPFSNLATLSFGDNTPPLTWYLTSTYGYNYVDSGAYKVCMAVADSVCNSVFCDTIVSVGASNGNSCYTSFSYSLPTIGTFMQFYGQTTALNPVVTWDFGDGTPPLQGGIGDLYPTHIYANAGLYTVCLTILDTTTACQSSYCDSIIIPSTTGGNLQAGFSYSVGNNGMVYFTDTSSPQGNLNYLWDFGNGLSSSLYSPSTAYTSTGWYNVCVVVTDIYNPGVSSTFCDSIYIASVQPDSCQASFTYITNPDSSVTFTSTAYGTNLGTYWNIYNSFYAVNLSGPNITVSLPSGSYYVDMTVYGNNCNGFNSQIVNIGGQYQPCDASFTYTIQPTGLVQFTNTSSSALSIPSMNYYYWDLGNGFTSSVDNPLMVYNNIGNYTVTLTQFDLSSGCQSVEIQNINISSISGNSGNCQANFSAQIDSTGLVTFTDLSSPAANLTYFWDFGDGTYSSTQNNVHAYGLSGNYHVCLTILDNATGCNNSICDTISAQGYNPYTPCDADFSYFADSTGNIQFFPPATTSQPIDIYYTWDFGNGVMDYTASPSYNFNDSLPHYVCLNVFDLQTACSQTYCDTVIPFSGYNARFAYQQQGNMVMFDNHSTGGMGMTYQWNLGEGQTSQQKDPIAVYQTAGWQNVCLTIWENGMMRGMYCDSVYINTLATAVQPTSDLVNSVSAPYPNPTNDKINVRIQDLRSNELSWIIFDVMGREIKSGIEKTQLKEYNLSIPVQTLSKGYYFLAIKIGEEKLMRKFVVE